jgi:hypothetical protein
VSRRVVSAVCGPLPDGTIEDEEQRYVVSGIVQWVLEALAAGQGPTPDEIVREAIGRIIFEAVATETAAQLNQEQVPLWATAEAERQFRDTADALARQAQLSASGATPADLVAAIEQGMEALRTIWQEE